VKVVALVQARMGSTRLPNKVMKIVEGFPMIGVLLKRLSKAKELDQIVVATSVDGRNLPLLNYVKELGYACFMGSENDVLERFHQAATDNNADIIVRITGDCPLVDPELVDQAIRDFKSKDVDYLSNISPPTYPDGLDIEIFSFTALSRAAQEAHQLYEREHVTPFLRESGLFKTANISFSEDFSDFRWTVDDQADFTVIENVFAHFKPNIYFSWHEVLGLQEKKPELFNINKFTKRNEGAIMGTGQKLWKRAQGVIPGGNMLLSKRSEMFLPDQWPAYFSKAKGCSVWDLDGKEYIDMSLMGVGTNILGYGDPAVDMAVKQTVDAGNMSTLNCPEEVFLAEKLVELHPWSDMVRFARSGGEANAIGVRIARAASGKDKVAICGYHGWHDWYLSANLGDEENLAGHLLPGLETNGVPKNLRGTVLPFTYNNFSELKNLVDNHDIGVIKMEVVRNMGPEDDFLHKVRELATERGIVLIFDECTSGFRETFGGIHKKYGVEPDMAMFGKALGNGYAITAIIGKREVMEAAQSSFISSTFWTERIGPTAALKTLEEMERIESWKIITEKGLKIKKRWGELADHHGLKIKQWGIPSLAGFSLDYTNALAYKTFISQEMLGNGILASNAIYSSVAHTETVTNRYFEVLDMVFQKISSCEEGILNVDQLLNGPICHDGFKRLN
jgi:glutamate-1-semialdehyde 2,1-aminomutase